MTQGLIPFAGRLSHLYCDDPSWAVHSGSSKRSRDGSCSSKMDPRADGLKMIIEQLSNNSEREGNARGQLPTIFHTRIPSGGGAWYKTGLEWLIQEERIC